MVAIPGAPAWKVISLGLFWGFAMGLPSWSVAGLFSPRKYCPRYWISLDGPVRPPRPRRVLTQGDAVDDGMMPAVEASAGGTAALRTRWGSIIAKG